MTFERKTAPPDAELALNDPSGEFCGYEGDIASHLKFWEEQAGQQAENVESDFPPDLTSDLCDVLAEANDGMSFFADRDTQQLSAVSLRAKQRIREIALKALGMSLFARFGGLYKTPEPLQTSSAFGLKPTKDELKPKHPVLHDLGEDDLGIPQYAFYVDTKDADEHFRIGQHPDQWFKRENLWVYRAPSFKPSKWLVSRLIDNDGMVTFPLMTALVPYVANVRLPAKSAD